MTRHGTAIEWTHVPGYKGESWNPVGGCSHASAGCRNCYAERLAARLQAQRHPVYAGVVAPSKRGPKFTGRLTVAPDDHPVWTEPLRWRAPRAIFVGDMSDLFHEDRPDAHIDRVLAVTALCPRHIFMLLTKRPERMREYFADAIERGGRIAATIHREFSQHNTVGISNCPRMPLPNVWLGTSVENQAAADARRGAMRALADAGWLTFCSYEPAIGGVDWTGWEFLRWLISGGESGPRARPSHPDWHRAARDFCARHAIAYLFKQWGAWAPYRHPDDGSVAPHVIARDGTMHRGDALNAECERPLYCTVRRFRSKEDAGALLDGCEHRAFPAICEAA